MHIEIEYKNDRVYHEILGRYDLVWRVDGGWYAESHTKGDPIFFGGTHHSGTVVQQYYFLPIYGGVWGDAQPVPWPNTKAREAFHRHVDFCKGDVSKALKMGCQVKVKTTI